MKKSSKTLPTFKNDKELENFLEETDLSDYLVPENLTPVRFEFAPKDKTLTMRLPASLLDAVKAHAEKAHIPYQRFIRSVLETAVSEKTR